MQTIGPLPPSTTPDLAQGSDRWWALENAVIEPLDFMTCG